MKKLVMLDIDNTLFDSGSYRNKFFKDIALLLKREKNIDEGKQLCSDIYDQLRMQLGFFSPHKFVDAVINEAAINPKFKEEITEAIFSRKSLKNNMHGEVQETLLALGKLAELGIFSQGDLLLQKAKLEEIKYLLTIDHVHIVENKIKVFEKIFGTYNGYKIFFIDDALPILWEVKKLYGQVFAIWIKRGRWAERQKDISGFHPDGTIFKLSEAVAIVKSN